jgi:hypothetical protein
MARRPPRLLAPSPEKSVQSLDSQAVAASAPPTPAPGPVVALVKAVRIDVTQRVIEIVIGRLVTDEEFRAAFVTDPRQALTLLQETGLELTRAEIAALVATDSELWERVATHVDPRLQRANLKR